MTTHVGGRQRARARTTTPGLAGVSVIVVAVIGGLFLIVPVVALVVRSLVEGALSVALTTPAIVAILDDLPDYPAGYAASYAENVVSREDDAAAVTGKLVIGEGDAAFVYASDAIANGLPTLPLPDAANVAAAYVGVVVAGSPHSAEAMAFLDWLRGPDGQAIFTRLGFDPVQ